MVNKFESREVIIDGIAYHVLMRKTIILGVEHPRIVIVSFLPNNEAEKLIRIAINTIKKYTKRAHELWIVDNCSPKKYLRWLTKQKDINLVLNTVQPNHDIAEYSASYANGIAIEIARRLVDPESQYFMTMHQDIAVCRYGWLDHLMSKFSEQVKASGVRMDTARFNSGVLHVLGFIVDFQLIRKLNLSYLPQLPALDVGDAISVGLKKAGYEIYASPNTLWDSMLIEKIDSNSSSKFFNVDRSLDDSGNVFFMHLGRGVLKTSKKDDYFDKTSVNDWYKHIKRYYL